VVTDVGETVILYAGTLRFGELELRFGSLLHAPIAGSARGESVLRAASVHAEDGGSVRLDAPALRARGCWQPLDPPVEQVLLADGDGRVTWSCLAPRARVMLELAGKPLAGLGYAERLQLSIAPWRLPIRELRWGRALTASASLTWIDWRRPGDEPPIRLAVRDGQPGEPLWADDLAVHGHGGPALRFEDNQVLRQGTIGSTVLSLVGRGLRDRLPEACLLLDECKWRARVHIGGQPGWAIHEVVRWP
jgi:hypothetical protein